MDNQAAGQRLRDARSKFFSTIKDAAIALDQPYATYRQHESGERGFKLEAEKYARRFQTSPEWLLYGRQEDQRARSLDMERVPIISWISAGQLAETGHQIEPEDDEWALLSGLPRGRYFATQVRGDSMDRFSPDGSVIVVNADDIDPVPGRAYVFSLRGETTYKVYQEEPVIRLEPYSTNPFNKPIFISDPRKVVVVGRVVRTFLDLP